MSPAAANATRRVRQGRETTSLPPDIAELGYITPKQAAKFLDKSVQALAAMRFNRSGPSYIRKGRTIRYTLADLIAWAEDGRVDLGHPLSTTKRR